MNEALTPNPPRSLDIALDAHSGFERASVHLEAFVNNPAFDELAALFGVSDVPQDTSERLGVLNELAADMWDFRRGAERQSTAWNDELLDVPGSDQWNAVFSAARKLGLVESSVPKEQNPDFLVVFGGANKAPLDRLRYGMEVTEGFGYVAYLGSSRPVSDAEREKAREYAPGAQTEFDLGCGAFETVLGAHAIDEVIEERDGDTWGMRLYEFEVDGETRCGFVLSTPQVIGDRRANTYDNLRFFAERAQLALTPDASVVAVTTGHYTQGQGIPAMQELTLEHGVSVETVGHDAAYSGVTRTPSQLLQELKSSVDAAKRLHDKLKDMSIPEELPENRQAFADLVETSFADAHAQGDSLASALRGLAARLPSHVDPESFKETVESYMYDLVIGIDSLTNKPMPHEVAAMPPRAIIDFEIFAKIVARQAYGEYILGVTA